MNPASIADSPRVEKPTITTWTAEEVSAFLNGVPRDRWFAGWVLSATTGMRRGEILGLRWGDFSLRGLEVAQTIDASGTIHTSAKTNKSQRLVALDPATRKAIDDHRLTVLEERVLFGADYENHDLIVAWEDGRPVRGDWWSKKFRRHCRDLGLRAIRFHELRHTWATLALGWD